MFSSSFLPQMISLRWNCRFKYQKMPTHIDSDCEISNYAWRLTSQPPQLGKGTPITAGKEAPIEGEWNVLSIVHTRITSHPSRTPSSLHTHSSCNVSQASRSPHIAKSNSCVWYTSLVALQIRLSWIRRFEPTTFHEGRKCSCGL